MKVKKPRIQNLSVCGIKEEIYLGLAPPSVDSSVTFN